MSSRSEGESRTLCCPTDRSLGTIFLLESEDDTSDWEQFGEARGAVNVPVGQGVRLVINPEAIQALSPLANPQPDALDTLDLSDTGIEGASLRHLAALTALRGLTLEGTPVTDEGLAHLRPLRLLQELDLGWTQITDEGLIHLRALHSLRRLNLSPLYRQITGSGLIHLS